MLWYKAWLETRVRFLICLLGIVALCGWNVYRMDDVHSNVNLAYYYSVLHTSHNQLVIMWVLAVNLMTMGGLLREKSVGAASFTLGLPVSRWGLMRVRIAVSLIENALLIVIPWLTMFVIGAINGKTHSIPQALFHLLLLAAGGSVYYGLALLAASLVEGEYTAPLVSIGIIIAIGSALDGPGLRHYNPGLFMAGAGLYDSHSGMLTGPVPWGTLAAYALVTACLMLASVKAVQTREF